MPDYSLEQICVYGIDRFIKEKIPEIDNTRILFSPSQVIAGEGVYEAVIVANPFEITPLPSGFTACKFGVYFTYRSDTESAEKYQLALAGIAQDFIQELILSVTAKDYAYSWFDTVVDDGVTERNASMSATLIGAGYESIRIGTQMEAGGGTPSSYTHVAMITIELTMNYLPLRLGV